MLKGYLTDRLYFTTWSIITVIGRLSTYPKLGIANRLQVRDRTSKQTLRIEDSILSAIVGLQCNTKVAKLTS